MNIKDEKFLLGSMIITTGIITTGLIYGGVQIGIMLLSFL